MLDGEGPLKAQPFYYQLDHLGTPQELTDYSGEIMWSAKYRAYGNLATLDIAEIDNPLRFQGQYFDAETGLHYNRHRYYNPGTGRFLTPDPIKLAGGLNNYQYVPNPTGWVDPLGWTSGKGSCPGSLSSSESPVGTPTKTSNNPLSPSLETDAHGNEIYYRTLSPEHLNELKANGEIPPTSETFISPSQAYSSAYSGKLIRFTTKPGTMEELKKIGVTANSGTAPLFPDMDQAKKGWKLYNALFKLEGKRKPHINSGNGVVNTGLGKGEALKSFNKNIIKFEEL